MSVGCGIFPLTWMCLCSLYDRARTAEESAPGAVHILFQPGDTQDPFLRRATNAQAAGELCWELCPGSCCPGDPGGAQEGQGSGLCQPGAVGALPALQQPGAGGPLPVGSSRWEQQHAVGLLRSRIWPSWQARSVINLRVGERGVLNSSGAGREGADKELTPCEAP